MQRVLVTGETGGLGREVVGKLAVAGYTVRVMSRRPLPDLGGPQAHTLGGMAKVWMAARGLSKRVVRLPLPGKFAAALRNGALLCTDGERGAITWAEWVKETYTRRSGGAVLNLRSTKDMKNTKE